MPETDIAEVTQPIDLEIVDDRLQLTITSGNQRRTYSISFHKALGAAHEVTILLDRQRRGACEIHAFPQKGRS